MKKGLATKNDYQQQIAIYVKRRAEYRLKYGFKSDKYLRLSKGINEKLKVWRRAIRRIEVTDKLIENLDLLIISFTGVSVKNSIHLSNATIILAKNLFIKYGMEHHIQGTKLCKYLGGKGKWTASHRRKRFTLSFKTNKNNREMWHRFKDFIKNNPS